MIKQEILITSNNRGKIQIVDVILDYSTTSFTIKRVTGQFGCKQIKQPEITGTAGKATRTVIEQAELEYNSHIKKYLDKGYKKFSSFSKKAITTFTQDELLAFVGKNKTDTNNIPKPMLAIQADKVASKSFEKVWLCSRKLDGVRCTMYFKDNEVHTATRGGGSYDDSVQHLLTDPHIIAFFVANPEVILDGELYHHGIPLQVLSGLARGKSPNVKPESVKLQYYIYDYISSDIFETRCAQLRNWKDQSELGKTKGVNIIEHYPLSGWTTIKKRHDVFVNEGYEGLVMRNPKKEYAIGKRSSMYMVKLKSYQDAEFEVVGFEEGLRPIDDMCFICKTEEGKTFKAKPMGDADVKENYIANMATLIGKKATIKFFNYSNDNIPTQPVFKSFREEGE